MKLAFVIWSVVAAAFLALAIYTRMSDKPASFWANTKAPEIKDIPAYNKSVSFLWASFAVLFEALGIPLLFSEQNSPKAVLPLLGVPILVIGLMVAYTRIEGKHKK